MLKWKLQQFSLKVMYLTRRIHLASNINFPLKLGSRNNNTPHSNLEFLEVNDCREITRIPKTIFRSDRMCYNSILLKPRNIKIRHFLKMFCCKSYCLHFLSPLQRGNVVTKLMTSFTFSQYGCSAT